VALRPRFTTGVPLSKTTTHYSQWYVVLHPPNGLDLEQFRPAVVRAEPYSPNLVEEEALSEVCDAKRES
jgi:hypothetical protein